MKRQRPQHPIRAYLVGAPGFMQHIVDAILKTPISPRYGMARQQQLSTGHIWALAGTHGSKDIDIA